MSGKQDKIQNGITKPSSGLNSSKKQSKPIVSCKYPSQVQHFLWIRFQSLNGLAIVRIHQRVSHNR